MDSNNNHIIDNYDDFIEQVGIQLVLDNFITALNQHDTAELTKFIRIPERLYFILLHLGIPKDLLHIPAYRQLLEEVLCHALNTIIESNCAIAGINNNNSNFFKVEIGSPMFVTDSFSLSKKEHTYEICQHSFHNGTKSESSKTISLDVLKNQILIKEHSSESIQDPNDFFKNQIKKSSNLTGIQLDSNGFAITYAKKTNGHIVSMFERNGRIITNNNNKVPWNGNPLYLNSEKSDSKTSIDNIARTIRRCPDSKDYYISVFGKEIIDEITNALEQG